MEPAPQPDRDPLAALGFDRAAIALRIRLDGAAAAGFLAELPDRVARWCDALDLRRPRLMPGGVLSAALCCRREGSEEEVVLKLQAADAPSAAAEAAALAAWAGDGACRLLFAAEEGRVTVLERIAPGTAVSPSGDDAADARGAAALLAHLHQIPAAAAPAAVPPARAELEWRFRRAHRMLDGPSHARGLIGHGDLEAARAAALRLDGEVPADRRVLLHGDYLGKNILRQGATGRRAIDPRPATGDPCLDAAFWALTHRPGVDVAGRCARIAAARGLDPVRVEAWARVFAVTEAVLVTDRGRAEAHAGVVRPGPRRGGPPR